MMNFVYTVMNIVLQMMNIAFQTMNFESGLFRQGQRFDFYIRNHEFCIRAGSFFH